MKIIRSNFLNPINPEKCEFFGDFCLFIDKDGIILSFIPFNDVEDSHIIPIIDLRNCIITPGFIDLHAHVPQYSAMGIGNGELLDWLNQYIVPLESKFIDKAFAYEQSISFFREALSFGTTTIVAYCTIHREATSISFESASTVGIRAFIGNSLIDLPNNYCYYMPIDNIKSDVGFLLHNHHGSNFGKLQYIVTPRYAGSCSSELMTFCAEVAQSEDLFMQTHLAENLLELEFIAELHPQNDNYTAIYEKAGLLTPKTILAHCIYLGDSELKIIKDSGSTICHCPSSNRFLKSGIMPLSKYVSQGQNIALGSDVGAGYSLSMLNEAKEAVETSKTYEIVHRFGNDPISVSRAFYYLTKAAADIMNISDIVGSIRVGLNADLAIFEMNQELSELTTEEILSILIYKKFNQKALAVLIKGECVYGEI